MLLQDHNTAIVLGYAIKTITPLDYATTRPYSTARLCYYKTIIMLDCLLAVNWFRAFKITT